VYIGLLEVVFDGSLGLGSGGIKGALVFANSARFLSLVAARPLSGTFITGHRFVTGWGESWASHWVGVAFSQPKAVYIYG